MAEMHTGAPGRRRATWRPDDKVYEFDSVSVRGAQSATISHDGVKRTDGRDCVLDGHRFSIPSFFSLPLATVSLLSDRHARRIGGHAPSPRRCSPDAKRYRREEVHRGKDYDWGCFYHGTVKIVQLLRPQGNVSGLPIGVERADTVVLPSNVWIVKDMHYNDHLRGVPRLVWYPTDTHPGANCRDLPMVNEVSELVINYKHWAGREGVPDTDGLESMLDMLRVPFQFGMEITVVALPEDVFEYIDTALHNLPPSLDDHPDLVMYKPLGRARELSVDEYAAEIGALAEVIESSVPPQGMGWRTFLVTADLGEPRDTPVSPAVQRTVMVQKSGINPWPARDSEDWGAMSPAWIPHRTRTYHRPPLTRSRSH